jgi:hypothetical protein
MPAPQFHLAFTKGLVSVMLLAATTVSTGQPPPTAKAKPRLDRFGGGWRDRGWRGGG